MNIRSNITPVTSDINALTQGKDWRIVSAVERMEHDSEQRDCKPLPLNI
jgi:hypothetical protein